MTTLSRYILQDLGKIFTVCFAGLLAVYLVIDFFEKVRKFLKYDAELYDIFLYFVFITPQISFQMAPVAVLMATLLSLGLLSRNNEITAMRSCGISLVRIALPYLGFSGTVAWVLFVLSAVIMPLSTLRAEYIKAVHIEKKNPSTTFKADRTWVQIGDQTLMNVQAVDHSGTVLRGVSLYYLGSEFKLRKVMEAKEAHYSKQGWVLHAGLERTLFADGTLHTFPFDTRAIDVEQVPEDFNAWLSFESQEMTLSHLRSYADRLRRDGYNYTRFLTDYHARVAFPFVCVVMALVGMALSLKRMGQRGGGIAVAIGHALVIGFLYWTTHSVAVQLGRSGVMMPMIAGWFANFTFLSFGLYLLMKVRY